MVKTSDGASVATPSPSSKAKKAKTEAGASPPAPAAMNLSPPNYPSTNIPVPAIAIRPSGTTNTPYPSISATTIKTLKWGDARDLMVPFLSEDEKATIHKKTRADLSKLLGARIKAGDITPEQFWAVVGVEKVQQQQKEKKKRLLDPAVAEAMKKNKMNAETMRSPAGGALTPPSKRPSSEKSPPVPIIPGTSPYPRPIMRMPGVSPTAGAHPHPGPAPFVHLPRPQYKYTLRVPPSIWPSTIYPPGIVIGEPIPPSPLGPPSVSGTFYSSSILAVGPDNKTVDEGNAINQMQYILNRLNFILLKLNAAHSDILSMTAHVVDIHENGMDVLEAYGKYMAGPPRAGDGKQMRSACAWTMIGVSGLMPAGCVVQLEVKVVVRRVMMTSLLLDRPPGVKI